MATKQTTTSGMAGEISTYVMRGRRTVKDLRDHFRLSEPAAQAILDNAAYAHDGPGGKGYAWYMKQVGLVLKGKGVFEAKRKPTGVQAIAAGALAVGEARRNADAEAGLLEADPYGHGKKIAIATLKLSAMGAKIMGGMDHAGAVLVLKDAGWSPKKIAAQLKKHGHGTADIKKWMGESLDEAAQKLSIKTAPKPIQDALRHMKSRVTYERGRFLTPDIIGMDRGMKEAIIKWRVDAKDPQMMGPGTIDGHLEQIAKRLTEGGMGELAGRRTGAGIVKKPASRAKNRGDAKRIPEARKRVSIVEGVLALQDRAHARELGLDEAEGRKIAGELRAAMQDGEAMQRISTKDRDVVRLQLVGFLMGGHEGKKGIGAYTKASAGTARRIAKKAKGPLAAVLGKAAAYFDQMAEGTDEYRLSGGSGGDRKAAARRGDPEGAASQTSGRHGAGKKAKREGTDEAKRMHVVYLPANQAYQTMFGSSPTSIGDGNRSLFNDLKELKDELRMVGLKLGKKKGKGYEIVKESVDEDEKANAKKMKAKGYGYIIIFQGGKPEPLYTKTVGQASKLLRDDYKGKKADIKKIEAFLDEASDDKTDDLPAKTERKLKDLASEMGAIKVTGKGPSINATFDDKKKAQRFLELAKKHGGDAAMRRSGDEEYTVHVDEGIVEIGDGRYFVEGAGMCESLDEARGHLLLEDVDEATPYDKLRKGLAAAKARDLVWYADLDMWHANFKVGSKPYHVTYTMASGGKLGFSSRTEIQRGAKKRGTKIANFAAVPPKVAADLKRILPGFEKNLLGGNYPSMESLDEARTAGPAPLTITITDIFDNGSWQHPRYTVNIETNNRDLYTFGMFDPGTQPDDKTYSASTAFTNFIKGAARPGEHQKRISQRKLPAGLRTQLDALVANPRRWHPDLEYDEDIADTYDPEYDYYAPGLRAATERGVYEGSMQVANTILAQLGGRRFMAMTGAKDFIGLSDGRGGVTFRVGRNSGGINVVKIMLTGADLYDVEYSSVRGANKKVKKADKGIYADMLRSSFEQATGMVASLGTTGRNEDELGEGGFDIVAQMRFEEHLKPGNKVRVYWTAGSFGHYEAKATVKKLNRSSITVTIDEPVPDRSGLGSTGYPKGHKINVPRAMADMGRNKWSMGMNAVHPPQGPGAFSLKESDELDEATKTEIPVRGHAEIVAIGWGGPLPKHTAFYYRTKGGVEHSASPSSYDTDQEARRKKAEPKFLELLTGAGVANPKKLVAQLKQRLPKDEELDEFTSGGSIPAIGQLHPWVEPYGSEMSLLHSPEELDDEDTPPDCVIDEHGNFEMVAEGSIKLQKHRGVRGEQMFVVLRDEQPIGFVRKLKDTRTDKFPWQAFRYKQTFKGDGTDETELLGSTYNPKAGKKLAVDAVISGKHLANDHDTFMRESLDENCDSARAAGNTHVVTGGPSQRVFYFPSKAEAKAFADSVSGAQVMTIDDYEEHLDAVGESDEEAEDMRGGLLEGVEGVEIIETGRTTLHDTLLNLFVRNPGRAYSASEISKLQTVSLAEAMKTLTVLVREGTLQFKRGEGYSLRSANPDALRLKGVDREKVRAPFSSRIHSRRTYDYSGSERASNPRRRNEDVDEGSMPDSIFTGTGRGGPKISRHLTPSDFSKGDAGGHGPVSTEQLRGPHPSTRQTQMVFAEDEVEDADETTTSGTVGGFDRAVLGGSEKHKRQFDRAYPEQKGRVGGIRDDKKGQRGPRSVFANGALGRVLEQMRESMPGREDYELCDLLDERTYKIIEVYRRKPGGKWVVADPYGKEWEYDEKSEAVGAANNLAETEQWSIYVYQGNGMRRDTGPKGDDRLPESQVRVNESVASNKRPVKLGPIEKEVMRVARAFRTQKFTTAEVQAASKQLGRLSTVEVTATIDGLIRKGMLAGARDYFSILGEDDEPLPIVRSREDVEREYREEAAGHSVQDPLDEGRTPPAGTLYIKNSSIFDSPSNKYDIPLFTRTLKAAGAKKVWTDNEFGWDNQPKVVLFTGLRGSDASAALDELPVFKRFGAIIADAHAHWESQENDDEPELTEALTPKSLKIGSFYSVFTSRHSTEPDHILFVTARQANGTARGVDYDVARNKSILASFNGYNLTGSRALLPRDIDGTAKANMARKLGSGKSFEDFNESVRTIDESSRWGRYLLPLDEAERFEIVDRYTALGIPHPDPKTMCKGQCEGTGFVPIHKDDAEEPWHTLWLEAEKVSPNEDGDDYHFVQCPDCKGTGKAGANKAAPRQLAASVERESLQFPEARLETYVLAAQAAGLSEDDPCFVFENGTFTVEVPVEIAPRLRELVGV